MKKVVLFSPQSFEHEAFSELEQENKISVQLIIYWDTDPIKKLHKLFPNSKKISCNKLISEGLDGNFENIDQKYFTYDVKKKFLNEENLFIHMVDRMDSSNNIKFEQRYNLYKYLICYFSEIVEKQNFDLFYCRTSPHDLVDYVAYIIFQNSNKKILTFNRSVIPGYYHVSNDFRFSDSFAKSFHEFSSEISDKYQDVKNYLNLIKEKSKLSEPGYMKFTTKKLSIIEKSNIFFKNVIKRFSNISLINIHSKNYYLNILSDFFSSTLKKRRFKESIKNHDLLVKNKEHENYIYFPLHYQPENSTNPLGSFYTDHFLCLSILSKCLPKNWHVYVKEHDAQHKYPSGYLGRDINYYSRINSMKNVSIIKSNKQEHFDLINEARAVGTITGTVGFEAFVLSTPVIVFGEIFFSNGPNVYKVKNDNDCKIAIDNINNNNVINSKETINQYINCLMSDCEKIQFGNTDALWLGKEGYDENENKEKFKKIVNQHI